MRGWRITEDARRWTVWRTRGPRKGLRSVHLSRKDAEAALEVYRRGGRALVSPPPPNPFRDWTEAVWRPRGLTIQDLADTIGVAGSTVYGLMAGEDGPGRAVATAIEDITEGAITVRSWKKS